MLAMTARAPGGVCSWQKSRSGVRKARLQGDEAGCSPCPEDVGRLSVIASLQPEVRSCYFDIGFIPPLAAMELAWPAEVAFEAQPWLLPSGETLIACLPRRFGIRIFRQALTPMPSPWFGTRPTGSGSRCDAARCVTVL